MISPHHFRFLALALLFIGTSSGATTVNSMMKFAFGANIGWISFRHDQPTSSGVVFGEFFLEGFAYAANVGWINFGSGTPANGLRYQNNSAADFGVNHDGLGNLAGYAYGANIGWVDFGWAAPTDPMRPRVDLLTGVFTGFAYSANIGWLNLGTGNLRTDRMAITDTDGDGINDAWEFLIFGGLASADATSDFDRDGASDHAEYTAGTSPDNTTDTFKILSIVYNGDFTQANIVFTTNATRVFRLETSDVLGVSPDVWTDSSLGTFLPDPGATTTKTISWPGTVRKFIRAVALKPLP